MNYILLCNLYRLFKPKSSKGVTPFQTPNTKVQLYPTSYIIKGQSLTLIKKKLNESRASLLQKGNSMSS